VVDQDLAERAIADQQVIADAAPPRERRHQRVIDRDRLASDHGGVGIGELCDRPPGDVAKHAPHRLAAAHRQRRARHLQEPERERAQEPDRDHGQHARSPGMSNDYPGW
jgi:hypothetical protein